jgi:lipopolysaccharide/colanic/teichoic acid biosynthesis glycosyltransferase
MLEPVTPVTNAVGQRSRPARSRQEWPRPVGEEDARGQPVIVIGSPGDIPRALEHPAFENGRFHVKAALAIEPGETRSEVNGLSNLLTATKATTVLIAGPVGTTTMRTVADIASVFHCDLLAVMPTEVLAEHTPVVVWSGEAPLVQLAGASRQRWQAVAKRAVDVIGAAIGILVCAPLMALIAIAIRLESPGSPVFRHERIGYRGKRFLCLKLRTMRVDAEERLRSDPIMYDLYRRHHFKIPDDRDPRVTRIGRFLRRTSLDELPQLWNVLMGEMSLVGPRPVVEEELVWYGEDQDIMLSVRPGITGAWAVNGRQSLGYPERCKTELSYVRQWTVGRDLQILVRTARILARSAVRRDVRSLKPM